MRSTTGRSELLRSLLPSSCCRDGTATDGALSPNRYHDENTTLEDLTHPEDIEHFKKHEQMEREQERMEQLKKKSIVEDNIPAKFRRD